MTTAIKNESAAPVSGRRVTSIDFFRGFTMFLLIGESTGFFNCINEVNNGFMKFLGMELEHHEWHGLHFWDLIQPFFMFIVGVAIPFAVANRRKKGDNDSTILKHAWKRSVILLLLGWILYNQGSDHIGFRMQNVLAQLSVTYIVAFLIQNKSFKFQLIFSFAVLLLIDLAYRFFPVESFNQPWEPYHNLGAWVNVQIEGTPKTSIWATLNAIPTIAHTVWGVLCGKVLMSDKLPSEKIKILLIAGVASLIIGFGLDWANVTPIIKKIATTSFVFASGGWAILALCFSYWFIDIRGGVEKYVKPFVVVGMNCIFIYVFFHIGVGDILNKIYTPYINSLLGWLGETASHFLISGAVWASLWYICYWMYKNKIFIKI
jgi:predicted acyltransferase